jgi:hypothetical protein
MGEYRFVHEPMISSSARCGCARLFKKLRLPLERVQPLLPIVIWDRLIEEDRARVAMAPLT